MKFTYNVIRSKRKSVSISVDAEGNITKNELGGIRIGYTTDNDKQAYKVQLDADGNAFVAVPWEHTTVSATSEGTGSGDKPYLTVKVTPTTETVKDVNEIIKKDNIIIEKKYSGHIDVYDSLMNIRDDYNVNARELNEAILKLNKLYK